MPHVQVVKFYHRIDSYDDTMHSIIPSSNWCEVSEEEYRKLEETIEYVNANRWRNTLRCDFTYILVKQLDSGFHELFADAQAFMKSIEDQKRKEEARLAKKKALDKEKALARKKRQLEKLKKELGE